MEAVRAAGRSLLALNSFKAKRGSPSERMTVRIVAKGADVGGKPSGFQAKE